MAESSAASSQKQEVGSARGAHYAGRLFEAIEPFGAIESFGAVEGTLRFRRAPRATSLPRGGATTSANFRPGTSPVKEYTPAIYW